MSPSANSELSPCLDSYSLQPPCQLFRIPAVASWMPLQHLTAVTVLCPLPLLSRPLAAQLACCPLHQPCWLSLLQTRIKHLSSCWTGCRGSACLCPMAIVFSQQVRAGWGQARRRGTALGSLRTGAGGWSPPPPRGRKEFPLLSSVLISDVCCGCHHPMPALEVAALARNRLIRSTPTQLCLLSREWGVWVSGWGAGRAVDRSVSVAEAWAQVMRARWPRMPGCCTVLLLSVGMSLSGPGC